MEAIMDPSVPHCREKEVSRSNAHWSNTSHHTAIIDPMRFMWRSYRTMVKGDDARWEGKKMNVGTSSNYTMSQEDVQAHLRRSLRSKLRQHLLDEEQLRAQHQAEVVALQEKHRILAAASYASTMARVRRLGLEGINRPSKAPPPPEHVCSPTNILVPANAIARAPAPATTTIPLKTKPAKPSPAASPAQLLPSLQQQRPSTPAIQLT